MTVRTMRRPAGQAGRQEAVEGSAKNDSAGQGEARVTSIRYECPLWDGIGRADFKAGRDGETRWMFVHETHGRYDSLHELAEAVGAGGVYELLEAPARWLAPFMMGEPRERSAERGEPWSPGLHAGWCHRLLASEPAALAWLRARGLSVETIHELQIGYAPGGTGTEPWAGHAAFVFPCNRKRFWPIVPTNAKGKPAKCVGLPGHSAVLWPKLPPGRLLLVCEGELDAALLRQHGLPAVTSTASTHWNAEWNQHIRGRRVAVVYDCGADSLGKARRRAEGFAAAGAVEAWAVDLGLDHGEDVTDYLATYNRSPHELRTLINGARRTR